MLAMEKSSTAMSLAIQVRNKVIAGYQELMRTQA
jgi:flagellar hook-basal body complex protein FliE